MNPKVSIVLPSLNASAYIKKTIESCLNQTYSNFELIIIDNCSSDKTNDIISSFHDKRIVHIKNDSNRGLIYSLNLGFKLAKGEYVARMDADDVCMPNRLKLQIDFLDKNPRITLLGSSILYINQNNYIYGKQRYIPLRHEEIEVEFLFRCPFNHPTTIFNKKNIEAEILNGLYNPNYFTAEDYELWQRIILTHKVANLKEPLLYYRRHTNNLSVTHKESQEELSFKIASEFCKLRYNLLLPPAFFHFLQLGVRNNNYLLNNSDIELYFKQFLSLKEKNLFFKKRIQFWLIESLLFSIKNRSIFLIFLLLKYIEPSKIIPTLIKEIKLLIEYYSTRLKRKLKS